MEANKLVVALLVVAIVFSVVSIVFLSSIGNLDLVLPKAASPVTVQAVSNQAGNIGLSVIGGTP